MLTHRTCSTAATVILFSVSLVDVSEPPAVLGMSKNTRGAETLHPAETPRLKNTQHNTHFTLM